MAGPDASEGQAVWQPGGAEEDCRLREGNRHLHLAYDDEEEVLLLIYPLIWHLSLYLLIHLLFSFFLSFFI